MKSSYRDSEHICKKVVHVQHRLGPGSHLTQYRLNDFGSLSMITIHGLLWSLDLLICQHRKLSTILSFHADLLPINAYQL
jgi:hypothetical protein